VSCYTDPLGIEHLTGSLAECIRYFGTRTDWPSALGQQVRQRGQPTRSAAQRPNALPGQRQRGPGRPAPGGGRRQRHATASRAWSSRRAARAGRGWLPRWPCNRADHADPDWEAHYAKLLDEAQAVLPHGCDLTFELITHRFTPGSKDVLLSWYPNTSLDLSEDNRDVKRNKFGGTKYVYRRDTMKELRIWFQREIAARFPQARILYWT
jgi:spore photoproduct lyase